MYKVEVLCVWDHVSLSLVNQKDKRYNNRAFKAFKPALWPTEDNFSYLSL